MEETDYEMIIFERFMDEVRTSIIKYDGKEIDRVTDLSTKEGHCKYKVFFEDNSWYMFVTYKQFLEFICNCVYVEEA